MKSTETKYENSVFNVKKLFYYLECGDVINHKSDEVLATGLSKENALLPTTDVVRGKVMFSEVSVRIFTREAEGEGGWDG